MSSNEKNAAAANPSRKSVRVPATDDHPAFEIDPEFEDLLPRLTPEESAGLAAQIERDKHVDDLVILVFDGHRVLGDGHNRRRICHEKGIPYRTREVQVGSREEAIAWMVQNQLSKRNLTDEQRDYFMGEHYLLTKQEPGGDRKSKSIDQNDQVIGSTAEAIAEKHGVSPATVRRNAKYAQGVNAIAEEEGAEEKANILSGKSKKTKAQIIARGRRTGKGKKPAKSTGKTKAAAKTSTSVDNDKSILELMNKVVELIEARGKTHKGEGFRRCREATEAMLEAFDDWQKGK